MYCEKVGMARILFEFALSYFNFEVYIGGAGVVRPKVSPFNRAYFFLNEIKILRDFLIYVYT